MTALIIFLAVAIAAVAFVWWQTTKRVKKEDEDPQVDNKPDKSADVQVPAVKPEDTEEPSGEPEKPVEEPEPVECSGMGSGRNDDFDVVQEADYDAEFEKRLGLFGGIVEIKRGSGNYKYMKSLYDEALAQCHGVSANGIPTLLAPCNFPSLAGYGTTARKDKAFDTLTGYLFAMHIASLRPKDRTALGKLGYELGGYDRYCNIYGYTYDGDPNNMRLLAGVIHAAMRGALKPDTAALREEIGGSKIDRNLADLAGGTRIEVGRDDFFTDLREFMPTAPGPYAPGYTTRPDKTYPDETRDEYGNLQVDRDVHEMVVRLYNLSNEAYRQETVQAVADKEAGKEHLFGGERITEHYRFKPVFGKDVLGITVDPESTLGEFASAVFSASNSARGILQAANTDPVQYGRLRPGCSWKSEASKNSTTDDRRNVLVNVEIEDNDGCKDTPNTFGHYDQNGYWVYTQAESDQYADQQKAALYANSYPSGHSAGVMGVAMLLVELFPQQADKILRAAMDFSLSRSKARYHWHSDIVNGRVLGVWQNAVAHASADYDEMLDKIREELGIM